MCPIRYKRQRYLDSGRQRVLTSLCFLWQFAKSLGSSQNALGDSPPATEYAILIREKEMCEIVSIGFKRIYLPFRLRINEEFEKLSLSWLKRLFASSAKTKIYSNGLSLESMAGSAWRLAAQSGHR
jgi:hypothetical protein